MRHVAKDRVLLLQLAPQASTKPVAHVIVHRDVLLQLGYVAPPVGLSWLMSSLWLQHAFASVGRWSHIMSWIATTHHC